ncbi:unnamed protein product [Urochloa humidicola]
MAEQAANAKHVADVLGAGVRAGVKTSAGGANAAAPELVGRERMAAKVRELMDDGEAVRRMRDRAEQVGRAAREAVGDGGTSRMALRQMVNELWRSYGVGDGGEGREDEDQRDAAAASAKRNV